MLKTLSQLWIISSENLVSKSMQFLRFTFRMKILVTKTKLFNLRLPHYRLSATETILTMSLTSIISSRISKILSSRMEYRQPSS